MNDNTKQLNEKHFKDEEILYQAEQQLETTKKVMRGERVEEPPEQ